MTTYTLDIPFVRPPMTANEQRRAHWRAVSRAKVEVATAVAAVARYAKVPHIDVPVRVTITWWAKTAGRRDPDSLGPFTKAALDALVCSGVLTDDSAEYVIETAQRARVDRGNPRITVEIEECL